MFGEESLLFGYPHKFASDISQFVNFVYELIQSIVVWVFSPPSHYASKHNNGLRIAVIGAGISGISSAAHCRGHGADVTVFEARSEKCLGGIWARVNSTSSLQLYSVMYRFHPTVRWHRKYPHQARILEEIRKLWYRYNLQTRTRFDTPIHSVKSRGGQWIINENPDAYGSFDGVIVATGTCGDPKMPPLPNEEQYEGTICHSSELDGVHMEDKCVLIVGGGASAIEAVEYAVAKGAKQVNIIARSEKWIIPRNIFVDALLSMNIFGEEPTFSFIPEFLLRWFFYRDLKDLAPHTKGFYTGTPMCNDQILDQIRTGRCRWLKSDILAATATGMSINHRGSKVPKGGPGTKMQVDADIIVKATGFERPDISFLPEDVFEEPFAPPAWYLQSFPPTHPEICAINSIYINAIGTVGHVHIGIYTRLLMVFLLEPSAKPTQAQMERWIVWVGWLKRKAPQAAFDYFTYGEMMLWFVSCILFRPAMWQWAWFVVTGLGQAGPRGVDTWKTVELKLQDLKGKVSEDSQP